MKVVYLWKLSFLMKVVFWWKLSFDESCLLMKVVCWWKLRYSKKWQCLNIWLCQGEEPRQEWCWKRKQTTSRDNGRGITVELHYGWIMWARKVRFDWFCFDQYHYEHWISVLQDLKYIPNIFISNLYICNLIVKCILKGENWGSREDTYTALPESSNSRGRGPGASARGYR